MPPMACTISSDGRLTVPSSFAGATVVVEKVSDTELRVRMAQVVPEDEVVFSEEARKPLSDRDRDSLLAMKENPPEPNEALKAAFLKYKNRG